MHVKAFGVLRSLKRKLTSLLVKEKMPETVFAERQSSWNRFHNTRTILQKSITSTSTAAPVTFMASLHQDTSPNVSFFFYYWWQAYRGLLLTSTSVGFGVGALLGTKSAAAALPPRTGSLLAHPRAFPTCTVLLEPMFWMNHRLFEWRPRSPAPPAQPAETAVVPLANPGACIFPNQQDKEDISNTSVQSRDHVKRAAEQQQLLTLTRGRSWRHSSKAKGHGLP